MQNIVNVSDDVIPTSIVPTAMAQQATVRGPQQTGYQTNTGGGSGGGGGGGIQIPSMEQMTASATSLLKKIAPTPPSQPPPEKSTSLLIHENVGPDDARDIVIGGEWFSVCVSNFLPLQRVSKSYSALWHFLTRVCGALKPHNEGVVLSCNFHCK